MSHYVELRAPLRIAVLQGAPTRAGLAASQPAAAPPSAYARGQAQIRAMIAAMHASQTSDQRDFSKAQRCVARLYDGLFALHEQHEALGAEMKTWRETVAVVATSFVGAYVPACRASVTQTADDATLHGTLDGHLSADRRALLVQTLSPAPVRRFEATLAALAAQVAQACRDVASVQADLFAREYRHTDQDVSMESRLQVARGRYTQCVQMSQGLRAGVARARGCSRAWLDGLVAQLVHEVTADAFGDDGRGSVY